MIRAALRLPIPAGKEIAMDKELKLIEEAINLENNVADIYMQFSEFFPDDKEFWWQLCMEEKNHAALLKAGLEFVTADMLPDELLFARIEDLRKVNGTLTRLKREYGHSKPSPEDALRLAMSLEDSAGESHYQLVMENKADSPAAELFQKLNEDDKDHARRIRIYAERHGYNIF